MVVLPEYDPIYLELPEAGSQDLLRYPIKRFKQFVESPRTGREVPEYEELPFAPDQADGRCDRAVRQFRFRFHVFMILHIHNAVRSYLFVRTLQIPGNEIRL